MKITIEINSCSDCSHSDHTGAFTKGGAKPCCSHSQMGVEFGEHKIIPYVSEPHPSVGGIKIHSPAKIPKWCPLKRGFNYLK